MRNQGLHIYFSKAAFLWLVSSLFIPVCYSQTTNINGVVNVYQHVTEVIPSKACVRVSNTAGLAQGRKVLLIQMKGASINTANSSTFGDTTSLNNAGNYEISTICTIRDDSVFFVYNILNNYTPSTGKVQLVQFGEYVNANVTADVTAPAWDNVNGTGGVIAIFAEADIIMNASITANGKGFAGGAFVQSNTACNNSTNGYSYDPTNVSAIFGQRGAYKGECIADVTATLYGGRGAPANGGGGGNNHNNSGGGGSNLNTGGMGGGNWGTSSCNASFPGIGGKALSSWGGRKIFFGGGGGAGHNNNGGASVGAGGNGGGIIFIHAANIIGNGQFISASGNAGSISQSDGAGGGGGGGTIIMDAGSYTGALTIAANGGNGGDSFDGGNLKLCFGGGGGGSGGVIYFTGAEPAITISNNGGNFGIESGSYLPTCTTPIPGISGSNGQIINSYSYKASTTLAAYCGTILPVRLTGFEARSSNKKVLLGWQTASPELVQLFMVEKRIGDNEWIQVGTVAGDESKQTYAAEDDHPQAGYNLYRLKVLEKNNTVSYSSIRRAYIDNRQEAFSIYPNPVTDKIRIEASFNGVLSLRLLDISGKTVFIKQGMMNNAVVIDLPHLPTGIYVLRINDTVKKIVIR